MNYRHSFHAGNFADLVKHALVLWLLRARQARMQGRGPVTVFDTHAGAGLYDLTGDGARSREAEAGVLKLMASQDLPPTIAALAAEVRAVNDGGAETRLYPGSPLLVARALRGDDAYCGFELNPPVVELLHQALADYPHADGSAGDGYVEALSAVRAAVKAGVRPAPLVLIDPPFERPDDYVRAAETAMAVVRADPKATVAVWTPLKDLETFDGFLRRLSGDVLVAEARLRPLTNPMKMNGCAMVVLNPPPGAEAAAQEICGWVADTLGDAGARAEVWRT
jgi:23S rRNA (adenine2030-N6)-methyltransferase